MIYQGDCLDWLGKVTDSSVDLVYIDPPFFTQRNFKDFVDRWDGIGSYVDYMRERVVVLHSKLKDTGSFMLHCDWHASHYLRVMLDEVFGYANFKNEIVWCYGVGGKSRNHFARKHDTILVYSKGKKNFFNGDAVRIPYELISPKSTTPFNLTDKDGRRHYKKKVNGKTYTYFKDEGKIPNDWWIDVQPLVARHGRKENLGYPTQKPEALLTRLIKCTTNEGDLVLDAFGGSGTTAAVAKKLKRKFITGDVNPKAVAIMRERLVKVD